jgi:hypothetical protein
MGWHAEARFREINKGAVLTILYTPYLVGYPPPELRAGTKMSIVFLTNERSSATVVDASENAITIEMPDTSRGKPSGR